MSDKQYIKTIERDNERLRKENEKLQKELEALKLEFQKHIDEYYDIDDIH